METYNAKREHLLGICDVFLQDNLSLSNTAGTIRGIHFQSPPHPQAKLVRCTRGALLDYVADLRNGSPTFGKYVSAELSAENGRQLYIPIGFGHALVTLENFTEVSYKVSDLYSAELDAGIRWNCPDVAINWGVGDADAPGPRADRRRVEGAQRVGVGAGRVLGHVQHGQPFADRERDGFLGELQ